MLCPYNHVAIQTIRLLCRLSLPSFDDMLAVIASAVVCADYAAAFRFLFSFNFRWFRQTVKTSLSMTADYVAAFRTFPFFRFFGQELVHALFFYEIQIIDHAYVILLVTLI
jgi:hypothetical protein